MECEALRDLLSAYVEDELPAADRTRLDEHLGRCPDCAELLSLMAKTREALSGFPEVEVSPSLRQRLHTIPERRKRFRFGFDLFARPSLQPYFAAASAVLVLFSVYFFNPNRSRFNQAVIRQLHLGYAKIERLYAKAESVTATLGEQKDNLLVSLDEVNPFSAKED